MELSITGLPVRAHARAFSVLFVSISLLAGCGEATCPAGSTQRGGMCIPIPDCDDDEVLEEGECVDPDASMPDGGDGDGDAATDASTSDSGDGAAEDPRCADLDCGANGSCTVTGGQARCECADNFVGELCDACEPGLGLKGDACVPACDADTAPDCAPHGDCEVIEGAAVCACEHPFAGENCLDCAEGFALQGDGTCKADCGECGPHAFCDAELMVPACACVAGYAKGSGDCEWVGDGTTGGIVDGELDDPDAWLTSHVTIDDGEARFDNTGSGDNCELGTMSQTLKMPEQDDAEPFVLEIDTATPCTQADSRNCPALLLDVGGSTTRVAVGGGSGPAARLGTQEVCLGAVAYGGEVPITIRPSLAQSYVATAYECDSDDWPAITAMRIRTAKEDECPESGQILGGSFEELAAWSVSGGSIANDAVTLDTSGLATTRVYIPTTEELPGAALAMNLSSNGILTVALDGIAFSYASSQVEPSMACIPEWARGSVHELAFYSTFGSATASDLSIERDVLCDEGGFDGGFERTGSAKTWSPFLVPAMTVSSEHHGGDQALRVGETSTPLGAPVRFPRREDDKSVAFMFWYRVASLNMRTNYALIGGGVTTSGMSTQTSWTSQAICVPRAWEGQLAMITLEVSASMTSGTGTPYAYYDDVGPLLIDNSICP